ncbi:hypothetical protein GCM10025864_17430 [Luteimicrobium album]|uniref:Uncharacterized protein n=1 Tax=Luteimicrobium album TaxID=1054550 RepID=A0ABQ6I211_9MICO|nr:hypothetical protein [Luteimicrobium album]GMA23984.1 hypothetical protein GCM10025864_17430 [Luteimicrobium album]
MLAPARPLVATGSFRLAAPVDVRATLLPHRRGPLDPAFQVGPDGAVWRATRTPTAQRPCGSWRPVPPP